MNALEIKNLTKIYPGYKLDDVSFDLPCGCILGLIGENGAGKSTVIKLISDMIKKDGGSIEILGQRDCGGLPSVKEEIGIVMDEVGIPECLNTKHVGKIMARTFKKWDNDYYNRLLHKLSIPSDKPFKEYSRGMKMKLGIAVALSHDPKLLILDEATSGLDPVARDQVVEMLYDFTREENHSVLISSHIVSDLEKLCDYIAFLHKGKLLLFEEKDRLLEKYGIIHCTEKQLSELDPKSVKHKKISAYGVEALVSRNDIPAGITIAPVSIEELFVQMAKEEERA